MTPYEYLKREIVLGNMLPGSVIEESEITKKLKISRTPVREAILRLNEEGFITIIPRKGTFVSTISLKNIKDVYELRIIIEPKAIKEACLKYDEEDLKRWINYYEKLIEGEEIEPPIKPESLEDVDKVFHIFLQSPLNNAILNKTIGKLMDNTSRIRNISNVMSEENKLAAYKEHIEILTFLLEKKPEDAKYAMKRHLERSLEAYYKL